MFEVVSTPIIRSYVKKWKGHKELFVSKCLSKYRIMKKKVIESLPVQDWEEQEGLRRKYAGIELPRVDPQGDWVTVEE